MPLRVELYGPGHVQAARALNARLEAGGVDPGFRLPDEPGPNLPPPLAKNTWLLLSDDGEVRGSWMQQDQLFRIAGEDVCAANIQLPLSEGLIDRTYASVSTVLLKHSERRNPLLFAVGMGSADQPWPRLIQAMGWKVRPVPFFFQVLRGGAFFRNIRPLRSSALRSALFDLAAVTGLGHIGIRLFHAIRRTAGPKLDAERVTSWGSWADDVWREVLPQCSVIGFRDAATLQALYPPASRVLCFRLMQDSTTVGWTALLSTPVTDHKQFGSMRIGTILDCMTVPGLELAGIDAATRLLAASGADIALANHTHELWQSALRANGYLEGPSNFLLGTSKQLTSRTGTGESRIWFTRGDGDGRLNL